MNQTVIIAVVAVFAASILLSIPFMLINKRMKRKDAARKTEAFDRGMGIVHFYGEKLTVNGRKLSKFEVKRGADGNQSVYLAPGQYRTVGNYPVSLPSLGENKNYTCKDAVLDFAVEPGREYDLGISLDERVLADALAWQEYLGSGGVRLFVTCHFTQPQ